MNPLIRSVTNKFFLPATRTMHRRYCTKSAQTINSKISTFLKFAFVGFGGGLLGYTWAGGFRQNRPLSKRYCRVPEYGSGVSRDTVWHSHCPRKGMLEALIHAEDFNIGNLNRWKNQLQADIESFESKMKKLKGADWAIVRAEKEADEELLDIVSGVIKRLLPIE